MQKLLNSYQRKRKTSFPDYLWKRKGTSFSDHEDSVAPNNIYFPFSSLFFLITVNDENLCDIFFCCSVLTGQFPRGRREEMWKNLLCRNLSLIFFLCIKAVSFVTLNSYMPCHKLWGEKSFLNTQRINRSCGCENVHSFLLKWSKCIW